MEIISRRRFLINSAKATSGSLIFGSNVLFGSSCKNQSRSSDSFKAFIPMPIQLVIDDVGWWSGEDRSTRQEPYRTGINRHHVPADYQAIADLGKALGIRPQAAVILCEWDKENILRQLPSATWMGDKWNNISRVGPWMEEAADIIRNNRDHFELTLHGIGHEYWEGGKFTRAEWTDSNGQMRPREQVELHLDYYSKLLDQHNLGPFPVSFVPTAFKHSFGPSEGQDVSLASLLHKRGINYINTPFQGMFNKERVQYGLFGIDDGVMTIDRGKDEFPWTGFPGNPGKEITEPTCGMHWPNILSPDPENNSKSVGNWINYLKPYNDKEDKMLAPDSVHFQHQLMHHSFTKVSVERNSINLNFAETDRIHGATEAKSVTVKIKSERPMQFRPGDLAIQTQTLLKNSKFLYTLNLERQSGNTEGRIRFSS